MIIHRNRNRPWSLRSRTALASAAMICTCFVGGPSAWAACDTLTIGYGTRTWEHPLNTLNHDSRTQSIYLASEIGDAGTITAVALNILTPPTQPLNSFTIRMKHTSQNSYSSAYLDPSSSFTVVYQNIESISSTGWYTFNLTTPFTYNGSNNLMIDFSFNNTYATARSFCEAWQPGVQRSVTKSADSNLGDPLTWSGTLYAARNDNTPRIQLTICGANMFDFTYLQRTATSITWKWTNAPSVDGYYGHDAADNLMWAVPTGVTSYVESSLSPNTQYTRHLHSYVGSTLSNPSDDVSVYTLPATPDVSCDRATGCPAHTVNTTFTFSNAIPFGGSGVDHYHYAWDREPSHSFIGTELEWSTGTIALTADQVGKWYLHLNSHNVEHTSGEMMSFGPFTVGSSRFDFDLDCDVDADDLDFLTGCAIGPGIPQNNPACAAARIDADDDVDMDDFAILQRCWSGQGVPADMNCEAE